MLAPAIAAVCVSLSLFASPAAAQQAPANTCRVLFVGFVGGLGTAHFPPSAASPLFRRIHALHAPGLCFKIFSGYCPWCGHRWVRKEFGASKGHLAAQQIADGPKVVAFGYSLGGPAALHFAKEAQSDGIPLELLATVDVVGFTQGVFPANVKVAANFYERRLHFILMEGRKTLRVEDPQATKFLGNIHVTTASHFHIPQSDPVSNLVLGTIRSLCEAQRSAGAAPETGPLVDPRTLALPGVG